MIEGALAEARDRMFRDGAPSVDWVDALRDIAERSLDVIEPVPRRNRYRIGFHIDTDGVAVDAHGWHLPDAIRNHITCDGVLDPTFVEAGRPISVGRQQHIVPDRTRRLILLRDQGCRVPGCTSQRFLEVHHIVHWLDDGVTDTWNLVAVCPRHHRLHHKGRLGISGDADEPDGVMFTFPNGDPFTGSGARPKPPGAPPQPPQPPDGTYEHPIGGRLDTRWLVFNPPQPNRFADRN